MLMGRGLLLLLGRELGRLELLLRLREMWLLGVERELQLLCGMLLFLL
jgi:hypothetical protein